MPYELLISVFQILNDLIKVPSTFQTDIITSIIALFVVIDLIGNIPLFIAFTKNYKKLNTKLYPKLLYLQSRIIISVWDSRNTDFATIWNDDL